MAVKSDIEIAREASMQRITEVAAKLDIGEEHLQPYGHYKAKVSLDYLDTLSDRPDGKLVLVTAISPTPAGEGKTTTTVGLGDGLNRIGKKAVMCLREPSLGPCFGVKGGAAGGGYAQVVPMVLTSLLHQKLWRSSAWRAASKICKLASVKSSLRKRVSVSPSVPKTSAAMAQ